MYQMFGPALSPLERPAPSDAADDSDEMGLNIFDSSATQTTMEPILTTDGKRKISATDTAAPLDKVQKRYRGKGAKKQKPSAKLSHSSDNAHYLKLDLRAGNSSATSMTPFRASRGPVHD